MLILSKIRNRIFNISTKRITFLGCSLAVMIVLKYALGFIPGIEIISFLFIFFGIFLPAFDLILLITSFNLLVMVIYGFGTWWIMYWFIWPFDAFVSKFLSKVTKNKYVFATWGFIAGTLVFIWYYFSDLFFFGSSFATLNIISAIPINLIEGATTMISIILLAPPMTSMMNQIYHKFYEQHKKWEFKKPKYPLFSLIASSSLGVIAVGSISALFVFNSVFLNIKEDLERKKHSSDVFFNDDGKIDGRQYLDGQSYMQFQDTLKKNEIGIIVIANHQKYNETLALQKGETLRHAMGRLSDLKFEYHNHLSLGDFVNRFSYQNSPFKGGTSSATNYGHVYPLFLWNHVYSQLGVSNLHPQAHDVFEFSYDNV